MHTTLSIEMKSSFQKTIWDLSPNLDTLFFSKVISIVLA
jgi:hypothetical protein